ncbi:hypothetical protein HK096_003455, partial [Nowakowskiella sp. JEL0078]
TDCTSSILNPEVPIHYPSVLGQFPTTFYPTSTSDHPDLQIKYQTDSVTITDVTVAPLVQNDNNKKLQFEDPESDSPLLNIDCADSLAT